MPKRTDDLQINGLKLIQDDESFCFGNDSVELANFVTGGSKDLAVDLGAGNGVITVLLAGKKGIKTTAVEIDPAAAALCQKNIELNGLNDMADTLNIPMQDLHTVLPAGSRTIVVTNPPYFKKGSGAVRQNAQAARHEIFITQEEIIKCAAHLLCENGRFYIVYPCTRLAELLSNCRQNKLEPKELVLLTTKNSPSSNIQTAKTEPQLFLLKCVKGGKTGLKVECREMRDYY